MERFGCLPALLLYLAMGFGIIGLSLSGHFSIPLNQDGDYVLMPWQQDQSKGYSLHVTIPNSDIPLRLKTESSYSYGGRWSSDGQRLLYLSSSNLTKSDQNKTALFVTDDPPNPGKRIVETNGIILSPSFSPDGHYVAYIEAPYNTFDQNASSRQPPKIYLVDLGQDPVSPILLMELDFVYTPQIQWSSDGKELLALRAVGVSAELSNPQKSAGVEIVRVNVETKAFTPVTRLIDFSQIDAEKMAPPALSKLENLFFSLVWSKDRIIFSAFEPYPEQISSQQFTPVQLYEWSDTDQKKTKLTEGNALHLFPTLSPYGDKLAYVKMSPEEKAQPSQSGQESQMTYTSEIHIMDFATREHRMVAGPGALLQPFWMNEELLGYVEFITNSSIVWMHDLKNHQRYELTSSIKTGVWKQRLSDERRKSERMYLDEIEKLRNKIVEKDSALQNLDVQLADNQREIESLKQRVEYQQNQITALRQQMEAERKQRKKPYLEILISTSLVLILLIFRSLF